MNWMLLAVIMGAILEWCVVAYILAFLSRQYRQKQLKILLLWYWSFFCLEGGVTCFLGAIVVPLVFGPNDIVSLVLYATGTLSFTGMLLFAFAFNIFVEYGNGRKRVAYLGGMALIGGLLAGIFLTPSQFVLEDTGVQGMQFLSLHAPPLLVGILFAGYFTVFVSKIFGRMLWENRRTPLKRKFACIVMGTTIHVFGFFAVLVWGSMTGVQGLSLLYPYPSAIGLLLFLKGLRQHPKYLIYLKQKAYRLIIFGPGGEVLFKYRFRNLPAAEDAYITAALMGLNQFLQNTLNMSPQVVFDTIDLHAYTVLSAFRGDLGLSLVVSGDSPVYRQALNFLLRTVPRMSANLPAGVSEQKNLQQQGLDSLNQLVEDTFFFFPEQDHFTEAGECLVS